jgi:hypothetical protein
MIEDSRSLQGSRMRHLLSPTRHPSAILFLVQMLGVLLYPFMEQAPHGQIALNIFGITVLVITTRMVRRTPGITWISVCLALAIIVVLALQSLYDLPGLLPWSSGLEALFYFYAAGSLIAYMMEDYRTTTDELYAAGATFTLLAWGFTHCFVVTQALQPGAFADPGSTAVRTWSDLNHLSFALLSSTGMGSVVAQSPHARAIASLEMMVGVMYLAGVVTRLIAFTTHTKE